MENTLDKSQKQPTEMEQKITANIATPEAACHLRNLILNSNITITAAQPQPPPQQQSNAPTHEKVKECKISARQPTLSDSIPLKKRKLSISISEDSTTTSNPLSSLPLSLISNGTLSVTSDSSRVSIENGVPILKEIGSTKKEAAFENAISISATTLTPIMTGVAPKTENGVPQQATKNTEFKRTNARTQCPKTTQPKKTLHASTVSKETVSTAQTPEKLGISKLLLKAMSDVSKASLFERIALIPNPSQMDFLTLLGLEIVVDNCCPGEMPEHAQLSLNPKPLQCDQCHTDFTVNWHFYNSPLKVLCDRCFAYNEHQILKAAQTIRLAKYYTKNSQQNPKAENMQFKAKNTTKTYGLKVEKAGPKPTQSQLYENYMKVAAIATKDTGGVSELTKLGASIAVNSQIFEAAKVVNSLDSNATALSRAHAVQNFQIALFEGLQQQLESGSSNKDHPLLHYQMNVAQMVKQANLNALKLDDPKNVDAPLNAIVRAVEAQHQNLMNTIQKEMPKSVE